MPVPGKPTEVKLIKPDGTVLDINDWNPYTNVGSYTTNATGLHDIPTQEAQISTGYARGGVFTGGRWQPRQLTLEVHINAGEGIAPKRNALHNAARDNLIIFLGQRGQPVTIRTQYLGTTNYWDINGTFQQGQYHEGTANYTITFTAPDPNLIHSDIETQEVLLDAAHVEQITVFNIGGNQPTYPVLVVQPTAQKTTRWSYARNYSAVNPQNIRLYSYPIALDFDFAWHIANGRMLANGQDILVYVNGIPHDYWFGNFPNADGLIWTEVDFEAGQTLAVSVVYSNPAAPIWELAGDGPIIDKNSSTNAAWRFGGAFGDVPGHPSLYDWKWGAHQAQAQGFAPILTHQPDPWDQEFPSPEYLNVAGGYIPFTVQVEGYAGLAWHHPCGITAVNHHGFTRMDPGSEKLVLRGLQADGTLIDVWSAPDSDTTMGLVDYTLPGVSITTTFATPVYAIVFAMRSLSVHVGGGTYMGGADRMTVTLNNPPTVSGAANGTSNETNIYMLQLTLENQTNGDEITINGLITWGGTAWNQVIIDFENEVIQMAGANMYYAFDQVGPIREEWFRLLPGANSVRVRDEAVEGLTVDFTWHERRI